MKSPTLRSIKDALQKPPGSPILWLNTEGEPPHPAALPLAPKRPPFWVDLKMHWVAWTSRHRSGLHNLKTLAKVLTILFQGIVPLLGGFIDGAATDDRPYTPFAHHYQWVFPLCNLGHYLGIWVAHACEWLVR